MRPVFNRPEMLYLSLESEQVAKEYYKMPETIFLNIFIVEYGADPKVKELIERFEGYKQIIYREKRYGLSKNILEGMKFCFDNTSDYVIYIEDDVLLHKTYFQFMDVLMNSDIEPYSILSPFNHIDEGEPNEVRAENHYAALAPLISKDFFKRYIYHCANDTFYKNPALFVQSIGKEYKNYWGREYKYKDKTTHHQQAGLINRLIDIARIKEGLQVYMPMLNRQQHIGMYGYNRKKGNNLEGNTFEERVENLRNIITDAEKMTQFSGDQRYQDYKAFNSKLDEWDGTLKIINKKW
jgi:hypothetical protein